MAEIEKTGIKQKSLRGGPVEVLVPNRVKWQHEYVLSGSHQERISCHHLSITQWVAGFCRLMREEQNSDIQKSMLDYLISLMDDANDFIWDVAKAYKIGLQEIIRYLLSLVIVKLFVYFRTGIIAHPIIPAVLYYCCPQ